MAATHRKKLVYSVDTPFTSAEWPEISSEDKDAILELLCSLLAPIGQHRQRHAKPSAGKRAIKRKRKQEGVEPRTSERSQRPPPPEIASFVDVGLASITRNLEKLAAADGSPEQLPGGSIGDQNGKPSPYAVIFVARSGQSSAFSCQLPQMVAVAAKCTPSVPPTRLVGHSKPCGEKISACLGIPRVSSIGIRAEAPMSKALVDFVQQHVPPVSVAWLDEAHDADYRQTRLKIEEKMVPAKKASKT